MEKEFSMSRQTVYLGRNRHGTMAGVNFSKYEKLDNVVQLRPITTKGKTCYACRLEIPAEDIHKFIFELEQLSATPWPTEEQAQLCPECGDGEIEGGAISIEGLNAVQEMSCVSCGCCWHDVYGLMSRIIDEHGEKEESEPERQFLNKYRHCGTEWEDVWSCGCNDECPVCGTKDIEPYESTDITEKENESCQR